MEILKKLNKQQKQAVNHNDGPLLIVAGAGTGKTMVITARIARLINDKLAKPEEILALTFTEKASCEMEERVDKLLPYGYVDLWISTFHSFCERVLKQHAIDIGLPGDFKLLNQTEQWMLVKQNLDKFNLDYYRPLGNPTKFIHTLLGHFSRCKDEEISPKNYLEYAEELRLNLGGDCQSQGVLSEVLENEETPQPPLSGGLNNNQPPQPPLSGGLNNNQTPQPPLSGGLESDTPLIRGARGVLNEGGKDVEMVKGVKNNKKTKKVKNSNISKIFQVENIDINEIKRLEEVANAYRVYQQLLLDNNALDFGDLINYTLKLFKDRPAILKKYQDQFKYIMVDEFQDTNWAQYELVKLLLNKKQNLVVVGDDDQSIYKFRGASVSNILNFVKDFPKTQKIVLNENYRSAQGILDLSYDFIQLNNPNRLECAQNVGASLAGAQNEMCINKKLNSNQDYKAEIKHLQGEDLDEEVRLVINKILELKDKETNWSDFAILTRANNTALPYINALQYANIPFIFYSMRGLYGKPIILDIMALFKLFDDYHESSAIYRALNISTLKINYEDFGRITYQTRRRAVSLYDTLKKIDMFKDVEENTKINVKKLLSIIDKYSQLVKEKRVSEIYHGLLKDSGLLAMLAKEDNQQNRDQLSHIDQFYRKIKKFEDDAIDPKLKYFMEEMKLEIDSGEEGALSLNLDAGPDEVRVMTIHSAKGLEFKYVFIVGMVDKRFPTIERKEPIQIPDELVKEILPEGDIHLQEERRLFYVAVTRAKKGLYFTSAQDYGGTRKKKVSRFIIEAKLDEVLGAHSGDDKFSKEGLSGDHPPQPPLSGGLQDTPLIRGARGVMYGGSKDEKNETNKKEKQEIYPIPKHFSFSQLAAFRTCPLQYKYNFLLKIPIHGKGVFSFGKTMHSTLQKFFQQIICSNEAKQTSLFDNEKKEKFNPTYDNLLKFYEESWIDEWYENQKSKREYKEKGKKILKDFYVKHKDKWPEVQKLESGFNLKIGDYKIRGTIDRIDSIQANNRDIKPPPSPPCPRRGTVVSSSFQGGGGGCDAVEIIDYKTGTPKKDGKLTADDKEQLLLYQIAVEEVLGLSPKKLTFYYLDNNSQVSFIGSQKDKDKLKEKILIQIENIKKSNFEATPGMLCKYCDFCEICEYRKF